MDEINDVDAHPIDFCTLAMFILGKVFRFLRDNPKTLVYHRQPSSASVIAQHYHSSATPSNENIDTIEPPHSSASPTSLPDIPGGAGTFSALGARLFSPPPQSRTIGWIVDAGPDFPSAISNELRSWQTNLYLRKRDTPTTRGRISYDASSKQIFTYLTPKRLLTASDLPPHFLQARTFHLVCSAERCIDIVDEISTGRNNARKHQHPSSTSALSSDEEEKPLVIYEPFPPTCTPASLPQILTTFPRTTIFSPNHRELGAFFSFTHPMGNLDKTAVEEQCENLLSQARVSINTETKSKAKANTNFAIVVRAGEEGCYIAPLSPSPSAFFATAKGRGIWLPAYHSQHNPTCNARFTDPTGCGNAFLGAFAVGYVRSGGDLIQAASWGNVAASFVGEQIGLPRLETVVASRTCVDEVWNGEAVRDRLGEYSRRIGAV